MLRHENDDDEEGRKTRREEACRKAGVESRPRPVTEGEIGHILLGELFTLVAASIPLGCAAGWALCWIMAQGLQSDLFRVPLVLLPSTFAFAILTMAGSTLVSALIVRRRLAQLDLVAVLKTRE